MVDIHIIISPQTANWSSIWCLLWILFSFSHPGQKVHTWPQSPNVKYSSCLEYMARGEAGEDEAGHQLGVGDDHTIPADQVQVLTHDVCSVVSLQVLQTLALLLPGAFRRHWVSNCRCQMSDLSTDLLEADDVWRAQKEKQAPPGHGSDWMPS